MATESIKIVDPDSGAGYDYDSIYDWEAGEQADLPTNDRIAIAKCRCTGGTEDNLGSSYTLINGWTTDSTRYIKIWTDPSEGYRHSGKWETGNKYRIVCTDGCILVLEDFFRLDGIQAKSSAAASYPVILSQGVESGAIHQVSNCVLVVRNSSTSKGQTGYRINDADVTSYIWNNIIFHYSENKGYNSYNNSAIYSQAANSVYIYSCTCIGDAFGIYRGSGTVTCKNTYAHGVRTTYTAFGGDITKTNCASSDTTADGTNPQTNVAFSTSSGAYFTDIGDSTFDLHIGSSSTLKDNGVDTSGESEPLNFTTDIDGITRSGTWDIGADEYMAAVSDLSISISECVGSNGQMA